MASPVDASRADDGAWMAQGMCRLSKAPPKIFFPTGNTADIAKAKKFCAACGVTKECLQYCIKYGEQGIWGGTTDEDRHKRERFPERYAS